MSEEDTKNPADEGGDVGASPSMPSNLEVVFDKKAKQIIFKDPTGQTATIKALVIEEEAEEEPAPEDPEEVPPLTPEQFRDALQRLDDLGLTWTADRTPRVKAKTKETDLQLASEEFHKVRKEYPRLPRELSAITFHFYSGSPVPEETIGNEEVLKEKIEIAQRFFLTEEHRSEFFFKHAIKVPYFSDIDWEVVMKTAENNVNKLVGVPYALLSLRLDKSDPLGGKSQTEHITVAADINLVKKLKGILDSVETALSATRELARALHASQESSAKETENASANTGTKEVG
jgi:hypothetical protein